MKNENLIYAIGAVLMLAGAAAKILHLPYGNLLFTIAFVGVLLFQAWHVSILKKRIKELEK
jgi:hypothetical protein